MNQLLFLLLILYSFVPLYAQEGDTGNIDSLNDNDNDNFIDSYDCFNSVLNGDSVRYLNGIACQGWIKDHYPNGQLKHNGLYEKGKLISYKNYYENGQIERSFIKKDPKKSRLTIWYQDGHIRTEALFYFESPLKWTDYLENGSIESEEEYNNSLDFYLKSNYYFDNGKPYLIMELINKKRRIYSCKEYFPSGIVKEEGQKIQNRATGDYPRIGMWIIYNEKGKIIRKEQYEKGLLINETTF